MTLKQKTYVFVVALVACIVYNELNRFFIIKQNPGNKQVNAKSLIHGGSIYSIDNASYILAIKNYLNGKGFAEKPNDVRSQVRRTPGYPLFYGFFYYLIGEAGAHRILPYIQSILFAFSALLLAIGTYNLTSNSRLALIAGILYGLNPFSTGYAYYTITEAIHPAFVICAFYMLSVAVNSNKIKHYIFTGALLCLAVLIRPINGLFFIPLGLLLLYKYGFWIAARNSAIVVTGFCLVITPWVIRNYKVTKGELILLEKIYDQDPMNYGRHHYYFMTWRKCWENPHSIKFTNDLIRKIANGEHFEEHVAQYVNDLPEYAFAGYTGNDVHQTLSDFATCYQLRNKGMPYDYIQQQVVADFLNYTSLYKSNRPVRYYLVSPAIRLKEFVFQSFSNMYGSLNPSDYQFSFAQKLIKGGMYLLNLILFLSLFFLVFAKGRNDIRIISLSFFVPTVGYLIFVHNHVEVRYLLGVYPFLFLSLAFFAEKIMLHFLSSSNHNRSN